MFIRDQHIYLAIIANMAVLIICTSLRAESLAVTGNLTIAGDTDLRGAASFGRLTEDANAKGFNVEVSQEGHLSYEEVWVETTGTIQETWVEDGYYDSMITNVDRYDWVNQGYWLLDIVDEFGNVTNPGTYQDNWVWQWVGYDSQSTSYWVSTGGHTEYTNNSCPAHYESVQVQTYDAPQARFSGTRSNTAWVWRNPGTTNSGGMRELMVLTAGGLSFPVPDDAVGTSRALLTHTSFEQSYTSPQVTDTNYQSFGSKVGKNKIEVWDHVGHNYADANNLGGAYTVLENKSESTLAPIGLTLSYSESLDGGATMNTSSTTITSSSARFGGSLTVDGPVTLAPQGDLNMGAFTHKPQN